jgi:GMP synthase-like glutamine amidotransferase
VASARPARLLVLQLDDSDPPARLADWLTDAGLELDVRALDAGEPVPADLDGYDGLLVLGGPMGAFDDETVPYLPGVRTLLRRAVTEQVPTLGVCLGHQLLAGANGGMVRRCADGPEIGAQLIAKRTAAAHDPLFADLPITPDVLQWHYDEVTVLPPGAVQLASSPASEHQAFRLGRVAWGIQFHIETTPDIVRQWAATDPGLTDWDLDAVVERAVAVHEDIAEVWPGFAAAFAEIVRDPDAAPGHDPSTGGGAADPAAVRAALAAEAAAARGVPLPMPELRPRDG